MSSWVQVSHNVWQMEMGCIGLCHAVLGLQHHDQLKRLLEDWEPQCL